MLLFHQPSNLQLHSTVENFFDMENFGVNAAPEAVNEEDSRPIEILNNTSKKINNNFQVGLLWREKDVHMPESYKMAEQRLIGIEKKIKRTLHLVLHIMVVFPAISTNSMLVSCCQLKYYLHRLRHGIYHILQYLIQTNLPK